MHRGDDGELGGETFQVRLASRDSAQPGLHYVSMKQASHFPLRTASAGEVPFPKGKSWKGCPGKHWSQLDTTLQVEGNSTHALVTNPERNKRSQTVQKVQSFL